MCKLSARIYVDKLPGLGGQLPPVPYAYGYSYCIIPTIVTNEARKTSGFAMVNFPSQKAFIGKTYLRKYNMADF